MHQPAATLAYCPRQSVNRPSWPAFVRHPPGGISDLTLLTASQAMPGALGRTRQCALRQDARPPSAGRFQHRQVSASSQQRQIPSRRQRVLGRGRQQSARVSAPTGLHTRAAVFKRRRSSEPRAAHRPRARPSDFAGPPFPQFPGLGSRRMHIHARIIRAASPVSARLDNLLHQRSLRCARRSYSTSDSCVPRGAIRAGALTPATRQLPAVSATVQPAASTSSRSARRWLEAVAQRFTTERCGEEVEPIDDHTNSSHAAAAGLKHVASTPSSALSR